MLSVAEAIAISVQHHKAGNLQQAEQLYRQVLEVEPRHVDALHLLGLVDYQRGRTKTAISSMSEAVRLRPNFAEAHNNLGAALQANGQLAEAVASFRLAVSIKPDYAEAHNNLGNGLRLQGKLDEAQTSLQQALRLKPNYAGALTNLGLVLQKMGRHDDALAYHQQALALAPENAEIYSNLGDVLVELNRHADAIAYYQRALAIQPDRAKTHNNLGNALVALDRLAEASACFQKAMALDPRLAEAFDSFGNLQRTLGSLDESRRFLEKAVSLAPDRPEFYYNLAESKSFTADDPHLPALEALAKQSLSREHQVFVHFALGKVYADLGRHEESFQHQLEGNRLKRQQTSYDEATTLGLFRRTAEVFTAERIREMSGQGEPSAAPLFIVGMPRCGSTLVEQVLASHPRVYGAGEIKAFSTAVTQIGENAVLFPDCVLAMNGDSLRWIGGRYIQQIRAMASPSADRITDKMLGNFLYVGLIHLALPSARILHVRRDPIDTCLSCFSKCFSSEQRYTYDLAELGHYYRGYETLMEHWRRVLPEGIMLEVRYEDLVADFEPEARRIVAHGGLDWDTRCLEFHRTERPIKNASATQVRQPLYRSSVGRRRPGAELLRPLLEALGRG